MATAFTMLSGSMFGYRTRLRIFPACMSSYCTNGVTLLTLRASKWIIPFRIKLWPNGQKELF